MKQRRIRDLSAGCKIIITRLTAFVFLGLFIGYGYLSQEIQLDFWASEELFDARTFPQIIAVAGIICSILLIVFPGSPGDDPESLRAGSVSTAPIVNQASNDGTSNPVIIGRLARPFILVMLMLGYTFALEPLGFLVSTACFLLLGFVILDPQGNHAAKVNAEEAPASAIGFTHSALRKLAVAVMVSLLFFGLMNWLGIYLESGIPGIGHA